MANDIAELTPKELKEIQDFLKSKQVDLQINFQPQRVRRIEDGSLIIDAPQFQTRFVKIVKKEKIETA